MLGSKHFWLFSYLVVLFHITVCATVPSEAEFGYFRHTVFEETAKGNRFQAL